MERGSTVHKETSILHSFTSTHSDGGSDVYEKTCHLIETGIVALLGPRTESIASYVKSISRAYDIPYLETRWDTSRPPGAAPPSLLPTSIEADQSFTIQIQPDIDSLNRAYLDLINYFRWKKFIIVFDSAEGMLKVTDYFLLFVSNGLICISP